MADINGMNMNISVLSQVVINWHNWLVWQYFCFGETSVVTFLWLPFYNKFSHQRTLKLSVLPNLLPSWFRLLIIFMCSFCWIPRVDSWPPCRRYEGCQGYSDCSAVLQSSSSPERDSSSAAKVGKQDRGHSWGAAPRGGSRILGAKEATQGTCCAVPSWDPFGRPTAAQPDPCPARAAVHSGRCWKQGEGAGAARRTASPSTSVLAPRFLQPSPPPAAMFHARGGAGEGERDGGSGRRASALPQGRRGWELGRAAGGSGGG